MQMTNKQLKNVLKKLSSILNVFIADLIKETENNAQLKKKYNPSVSKPVKIQKNIIYF